MKPDTFPERQRTGTPPWTKVVLGGGTIAGKGLAQPPSVNAMMTPNMSLTLIPKS